MADRNYSLSFNQNKGAPSFGYVWDSTATITGAGGAVVTGAWTPATPAAGGGGGGGTADFTATNVLLQSGVKSEAAGSKTCSSNFTGSLLAKGSAGELHSIFGYNSGAAQFLRIYDGSTTGAAVAGVIAIPAQNNFSVDFGSHGAIFSNGIFVALSSSASTPVTGGNDAIITIIWK